ncbi:hypothetical protein KT999_11980 [Proteus mirabilis]|uniref:hypothetical protein n=1 Tax=Proteus mirabilis TaxID=584 RepID=UPI002181F814|nr:hypothetical protein [Proteus mirabilis]MCT0099769.1 hypothetical protein [Proteus mirabilis]
MDYLITYGIAILLLVLCIWWNWDVVKLNSHSLHLQWLFWIAVIFPILSCVYFGSIIWYEYPLEVSKNGYNSFLEISKLPLYLLAGTPILGAFVVSAHRSIQTAKQIEVTEKKNKVDIYIARRNFIIERLKNLDFFDENNVNVIYDYFYTFDNYTDIINKNNFLSVQKRINSINKLTNNIISHKTSLPLNHDIFTDINPLLNIISNLSKETGLVSSYIDELKKMSEELKVKVNENIKSGDNSYFNNLSFFLTDFTYTLNQIHSSLHELFTILLLEKKVEDYLPNLEKLIISTNGDKVATENQNNHE